MILFRDLPLNTHRAYCDWLEEGMHYYLSGLDPDLDYAAVGTTLMRSFYTDLAVGDGWELMLTFFAWGDTHDETMNNLNRVFTNINHALYYLVNDINEKLYRNEPSD